MLIVGLTGGVASGKTTVSKVLKEEGAYIIDADQMARELVQPHTAAWKELVNAFGQGILHQDGSIHRKKLADIVFADLDRRKLLNQILHPRIREEMGRRVKEIGRKDPEAIVVIDAPLLVELGEHRKMDRLIVVTSTQTRRIERLKKRDGISRAAALKIFSSQMAVRDKVKLADFVIRNEGSFEETREKTREVFQKLKNGVGHATGKRALLNAGCTKGPFGKSTGVRRSSAKDRDYGKRYLNKGRIKEKI